MRFGASMVAPCIPYKILYVPDVGRTKPIAFHGIALSDLRAFPVAARREAGFQLDRRQQGGEPTDWKMMSSVGSGVREIRIRDAAGAFRVIYLAKLADAIHVLHCFQKKSQATSGSDLALATRRYDALMAEARR